MDGNKPIPVFGRDGLIGQVEHGTQPPADNLMRVQLYDGQAILVPAELLLEQQDGSYYLPMSRSQFAEMQEPDEGEQMLVIPVIVEEARVRKQRTVSGRVRINKHVDTREEVVNPPLYREEVRVEHVPVDRWVEKPPEVRSEGDTLIIPVLEEVLVVEKRLKLKEEVRVTRQKVETRQPRSVMLRSERVDVERIGPEESAPIHGVDDNRNQTMPGDSSGKVQP